MYSPITQHLMKFAVKIPLPEPLQNRPIEHLKERPDLVGMLHQLVNDLEHWGYTHCDKNFVIGSDEIVNNSIEIHFETQSDKQKFIDQWPYEYSKIKIKQPKYSVSWLDSIES